MLSKIEKSVTFYRMDSDEESIETTAVFNLAIKDGDQHLEFYRH